MGQKGVRHAHQAEDIGLEGGAHVVGRGLGDLGARADDARIVDQHVEAGLRGDDLRGRLDRPVIGDVELDETRAQVLGRLGAPVGVACRCPHGVALRDHLRAVSWPSPLFAPVISVVVMQQWWTCPPEATRGGPILGLPDPCWPSEAGHTWAMDQQTELAACLRSWRDRLAPSAVGLPTQTRRRAPGLRREELAQLAGLSADYLTRLEQGRASNPSREVIAALARALRLSSDEEAHLFRVAGHVPPGPGRMSRHMTPSPSGSSSAWKRCLCW